MSLYLDTSLLVAAMTNEEQTECIQTWLSSLEGQDLLISEWVATEFSSALSIKVRTGQIEAKDRVAALAAYRQIAAYSFTFAPVTGEHFRIAGRFAEHYELGLRAGDALHLAIASEQGLTLCTLDRKLAAAGMALATSTRLI